MSSCQVPSKYQQSWLSLTGIRQQLWSVDAAENFDQNRVEVLRQLSEGRIDTETAAANLLASAHEASNDSDFAIEISWVWRLIIAYAREYPTAQPHLVALLAQLLSRPEVTALDRLPNGEPEIHFVVNMNYQWNYLEVPIDDGPDRNEIIHRFNTINRFAALLLKASIHPDAMWNYILWTFVDALEEREDRYMLEKPLGDTVRAFDVSVPAAAILIDAIGDMLFKAEESSPPAPGDGSLTGAGVLWDGYAGYCRDRWDLWKRRFEEIASLEDAREGTRAAARRAAGTMTVIERNHEQVSEI